MRRLVNNFLGASWMIAVGTGILATAWWRVAKGAAKQLVK